MRGGSVARTVAAWLRRPTDEATGAAYLAVTSCGLAAWLAWSGAARVGALAVMTVVAQVALAIGGGAFVVRALTWRRASRAAGLVMSSTAVAGWIGADNLHVAVFGDHLDGARIELLVQALRSHALKMDYGLLATLAATLVLLATSLRALLFALGHIPGLPRLATACERLGGPTAATLAVWVLFDPGGPEGDALRAPLPWAPSTVHAGRSTGASSPFDVGAEERMFSRLEAGREAMIAGQVSARRRPNIVIVHAESVRYDMLRDDVMPNTLRLSRACISPERHYSTSNNTGSSMFGILTGLPVSYYPLARRAGHPPIPLQLLKRLGYSISAYYSAYLSTYDGLCDLFFKGVADHMVEERDNPADAADSALVEHYLAGLAKRDPSAATFDYVVLESSHYDYAYPATYERFTPTATLGVGIRDGLIARAGINDELKPRGPFIRNRYQNSILWIDSLISKLALAWAERDPDAILVVTGDHGESFWEHGSFGHGTSLCDEQTRVPLVLCVPGATATRYTYSSHADIFATIFDYMGLRTGPLPFIAGKSLLEYDASRDVAVFGYGLTGSEYDDRLGVAGDGLKVVFTDRAPFPTISVSRDGDVEMPLPLPGDIEARADDLKVRALQARILR